jgi:hypothetical protein
MIPLLINPQFLSALRTVPLSATSRNLREADASEVEPFFFALYKTLAHISSALQITSSKEVVPKREVENDVPLRSHKQS